MNQSAIKPNPDREECDYSSNRMGAVLKLAEKRRYTQKGGSWPSNCYRTRADGASVYRLGADGYCLDCRIKELLWEI